MRVSPISNGKRKANVEVVDPLVFEWMKVYQIQLMQRRNKALSSIWPSERELSQRLLRNRFESIFPIPDERVGQKFLMELFAKYCKEKD